MSRYFDETYHSSIMYSNDNSEWLTVSGYPGYHICKEGYITEDKTGKQVKFHKGDKAGHINVRLKNKNGQIKEEYVHRLVAKTFIPNNDKTRPFVLHIDDDKENNNLSNLKWGNYKENHLDSVRNKTYKSVTNEDREMGMKKIRKPIKSINLKTNKEENFISINECARKLNLQSANIGKVLHNQRKHTCGYSFEFLERSRYD